MARWKRRAAASRRAFAIAACVMVLSTRTASAAPTRARFATRRLDDDRFAAPVVTRATPRRGHASGGADVAVRGARFASDASRVRCAFAFGDGEVVVTRATAAPRDEATRERERVVVCVAPRARSGARGAAQILLKNGDDGAWSGTAGNWAYGDGNTFATYEYDDSDPGCYGCRGSATAIASRPRETWALVGDRAVNVGPAEGGTTIRVKAFGANANANAVGGTFYPGANLKCGVACATTVGSGWLRVTMPAKWIAYDEIECVTPRWPGIGATSGTPSTTCHVRASNDGGERFDDLVAAGGDGDGTFATPMANAAKIDFTYDASGAAPSVSSVETSRAPAASARGARGPFDGGTVVTVRGSGFLSSSNLACKFFDPLGNEVVVRASYESSSEVRCASPSQIASVDPYAVDYVAMTSPCYASAVHVSNTGLVGSWSAANSAPTAQFFYCDLYVDSSAASASSADGSALKPFDTIQRALQSALTGVQSASDTHIGREFALANPTANALLNADVVRLAPGAYAGAGAVRLVADPTSSVRVRAATGVASAAADRAYIDCEGSNPLFADLDAQSSSSRVAVVVDPDVAVVRCRDADASVYGVESCETIVATDGSGVTAQPCNFAAA